MFEALDIMVDYVFCYRSECATRAQKFFLRFTPTSNELLTQSVSEMIIGSKSR
jgi:hypothetical protein